jgi:hypothetical protein
MAIDWRCTIAFAILTLVIYLILCQIFHKDGESKESMEMWKTCEAFILYSAAIAYNINTWIFAGCRM